MKRYTLDKGTQRTPVLEIDGAIATSARAAKKVIINMLTAEEKYDALVENFVEFEQTLLEITLEYKMFGGRTEDWFNLARNKIDRRFFNLLSTCRSYVEFGAHCASEIGPAMKLFQAERRKHYDESFAYRLMDGLRNHVTYAGHAAHIVTFSAQREEIADDFMLNYHTPTLELLSARLAENTDFKSQLLEEITEKGNEISFVPLLREYIRRLSQIHEFLRALCRPAVNRSRKALADLLTMFRNAHKDTEDFNGLVVREYDGEEQIADFWIVPFASRLDYFEEKNKVLSNLERSGVTNAIPNQAN